MSWHYILSSHVDRNYHFIQTDFYQKLPRLPTYSASHFYFPPISNNPNQSHPIIFTLPSTLFASFIHLLIYKNNQCIGTNLFFLRNRSNLGSDLLISIISYWHSSSQQTKTCFLKLGLLYSDNRICSPIHSFLLEESLSSVS